MNRTKRILILAGIGAALLGSAAAIYFAHISPPARTTLAPVAQPEDSAPAPDPQPASSGLAGSSAGQKQAFLTFDDGPCKSTPELLDTLRENGVQATFFVIGLQAQKYPDALRQMAADGDVIGVHSWTHKYSYIYQNMQNFSADFNQLKDYIQQVTGVAPDVCRFPGGTSNTVSRHYSKDHIMQQAVSYVQSEGFQYYDWNVSSGEAAAKRPSKDEIVNNVLSQCQKRTVAVILFHDDDNEDYIQAVPQIIDGLRSMGFDFETLSPGNPDVSQYKSVQFAPQ